MKRKITILAAVFLTLCVLFAAFLSQPKADLGAPAPNESIQKDDLPLPVQDEVKEDVPKEEKEEPHEKETVAPKKEPTVAKQDKENPTLEKTEPIKEEEKNTEQKEEGKLTCTISVRCDILLSHLDKLAEAKRSLVPADGVILASQKVEFFEGESVFQVLRRTLKANKIHLEFVSTPVYGSAYIEGMHNLYEFDAGELSGWLYRVNGVFPGVGASKTLLKEGDVIEWMYTCDLGRDVGAPEGVLQK